MIKQARKHKVQGGYSKYGLCMNTAYRNLGQFTAQLSLDEAMIPWWGSHEIWDIQSNENNKIWSVGENGV